MRDIRKMRKGRKAQHEIMGFVLIIVLIVIVGLVFLAFMLKPSSDIEYNPEVSELLYSILGYTSNCTVLGSSEPLAMRDLLKECYDNEECFGGEDSCQHAQSLVSEMLKEALDFKNDMKAYIFNASYSSSIGEFTKDLIYTHQNICNGSMKGARELIPIKNGEIKAYLNICYS